MTVLLRLMVACIACVAVYDIYCTVKLHDSLLHCEENPAALLLVSKRQNVFYAENPLSKEKTVSVAVTTIDVSRLVLLKSIGLCLALVIMERMIDTHRRISQAVIIPVFVGSIWLLSRLIH